MSTAALITWIITAGFGFYMLSIWLRGGGAQSADGSASSFRPPVVFGHFGLAATGLVLWIIYVFTDAAALAWIAFILLVVVAVLGDLLVVRWLKDRRAVGHSVGSMHAGQALAEQKFPTPVVALHGVFAVTTVVLVLLAAIGVGGS
jgi:hypothetical protein